jgi:hypothetical protein
MSGPFTYSLAVSAKAGTEPKSGWGSGVSLPPFSFQGSHFSVLHTPSLAWYFPAIIEESEKPRKYEATLEIVGVVRVH